MAMACLRLVTFFPERPDRRVPSFSSCMLRSTFLEAFAPYLREPVLRVRLAVFLLPLAVLELRLDAMGSLRATSVPWRSPLSASSFYGEASRRSERPCARQNCRSESALQS